MMIKFNIPFLVLTLLFSSYIYSEDDKYKQGYEVMKKVREQSRLHKTQSSEVYMVIYDKENRSRDRYFNNLKKISGNKEQSMVKFFKPASIKGTSLLSISTDGFEDADQFIFLPAFGSVKKLSTDDKGQSFMGSDFTNSDIAGRLLDKDKHTLVKEDNEYFYIKSTPKSSTDIYSLIESKVAKSIYLPIEVKFFDQKNTLLKIMSSKKVKKIDGMYLVSSCEMLNKQTGGKTTLDISEIEVGIDIADGDVGIKGLKK